MVENPTLSVKLTVLNSLQSSPTFTYDFPICPQKPSVLFFFLSMHIFLSGSEDKRIITWDAVKGVPLSSLQLHLPILGLSMSTDVTRIAVHLFESRHLPIICLHNTPATYVKAPVYVAPAKEIEGMDSSVCYIYISGLRTIIV